MDLELDFIKNNYAIIRINPADYLSKHKDFSYHFKLLDNQYTIGFFRKEIDLNGFLRINS